MTWTERFTDKLYELARDDDRAALAQLRRSLDQETRSFAGAARVIAHTLPASLPRWSEDDAYLLAALFALAPSAGGEPLPTLLRRVGMVTESSSVELRFTSLIASSREDLAVHLRHAVTLAASKDFAIDWKDLFDDLRSWGLPSGKTQKKWARLFWGANDSQEPTKERNAQ